MDTEVALNELYAYLLGLGADGSIGGYMASKMLAHIATLKKAINGR